MSGSEVYDDREKTPPPGSTVKQRLTWIRALANERRLRDATMQLADLVEELHYMHGDLDRAGEAPRHGG